MLPDIGVAIVKRKKLSSECPLKLSISYLKSPVAIRKKPTSGCPVHAAIATREHKRARLTQKQVE